MANYYVGVFSTLLSKYKKSDIRDEAVLKDPNSDWRAKEIAKIELCYKKLLQDHIRMGEVLVSFLGRLRTKQDLDFKAKYLKRVEGSDLKKGEKFLLRLKLSRYLKSLYMSKWIN